MDEPDSLDGFHSIDPALDASVVMPMFQAEAVVADQLRALTAQTFTGSWEVVIADNGCTDGSIREAERFRSALPSLRIVNASGVRGPSHARNIGALHARGRLLLFCDADDVVSPCWVEEMVAAAPTADLLAGTGIASRNPEGLIAQFEPAQRGVVPSHFRFLPWNRSSNLAADSTVFAAIGGFDESRRIGEDVDLCWRTQLAGYRFRFVETAFVAYRDRDTLSAAVSRQYAFGRAAPALYEDFAVMGAPPVTLGLLGRHYVQFLLAAPWALISATRRRNWLVGMAGAVGRSVGLVRQRLESARWRESRLDS